jgi:ribosome-binding protein aMBF1 (putative translation factor)
LTLVPLDGSLSNTSGFSTLMAIDLQVILQCVHAAQKSSKSEDWSAEEQQDASFAIAAPITTRLSLALRSSQWLKNQFAELQRQAGQVGKSDVIYQKFVITMEIFKTIVTKIASGELVYDQETKDLLERILGLKSIKQQAANMCQSELKDKPMEAWINEAKGQTHTILAKLIDQAEALVKWFMEVDFFKGDPVTAPAFWQELRVTGIPDPKVFQSSQGHTNRQFTRKCPFLAELSLVSNPNGEGP